MRTHASRLLILALFIALFVTVGCSKQAPLQPGAQAPDVSLLDQTGTFQSIGTFKGQPVLVYFYPKDSTPGCTTEACAFRDVWTKFEEAGVVVIGVSGDDVASHAAFAQEHNLPFLLLSDTDAELASAFGLKSRMGFLPRVSFLIDSESIIRAVYPDVDPGVHAQDVLDDVERLGLVPQTM